ncbi:MAG TPA: hypothetical protein PL066_01000 [bacterium]|nr:hypothetical protein [bacterium]
MEYCKDNVLNLAEMILREEDEVLLPISKLVHLLLQEQEAWTLDKETLKDYLKNDSRFLCYDFPEEAELWDDNLDAKMAEQGLFKGDKVMLYDRKPSADDLRQMILGNLDYLYRNLSEVGANPLEESQSLQYQQMMAKAKELYEHFQDLVLEEDKQDD